MAPLEPWEKVMVDAETFTSDVHGQIPCTTCHGGEQSADKDTAHTGMIARPSRTESWQTCGYCHESINTAADGSLHGTLNGYFTVLDQRSVPENHPAIDEMFGNHCASCHASCGDCHISQPASVGGGFIDGHIIQLKPSMTRNCTACHGSRVGNEYLGKNEGIRPDVHFSQARMVCTDCHTGAEMHGTAEGTANATHRYDGAEMPACTDCHAEVGNAEDANPMHTQHGNSLACQVCHSQQYTSCDNCHVEISSVTGNPIFSTDGHYLSFAIGRNPIQSEDRPYDFVLLRHVPIAPDSFSFYGDNLLPNFNMRPTWQYATPHNIQRVTPQAESCAACHGNPAYFLTADRVAESELEANAPVIVDQVPSLAP